MIFLLNVSVEPSQVNRLTLLEIGVPAVLERGGVVEVDKVIDIKMRRKCDAEQAALAVAGDGQIQRRAGDRTTGEDFHLAGCFLQDRVPWPSGRNWMPVG